MWAILAPPKPLNSFQSRVSVWAIPLKEENLLRILRESSTALVPLVPVRKRIAKSSELLKAPAPFLSNFSLGLSSKGQLLIPFDFMFFVTFYTTSQCPPLSGPTRFKRPFFFNRVIFLSMAVVLIPICVAKLSFEIDGLCLIISSIFF